MTNETLDKARRRTGKQILAMHKIMDETGWPAYYKTDFTEHDVATLNDLKPRSFIWQVRESGTELYVLDIPNNNFLADEEWFTATCKSHGENVKNYLFVETTPITISRDEGVALIRNSTAHKARNAPVPVGSPVIYSENGFIIGRWEKGTLKHDTTHLWGINRDSSPYSYTDWISKKEGKIYRDFDKERKNA